MGTGTFKVHVNINPFEKQPTFDLDAELKNVELTKLNNFIRAYGDFDVERGTFELFKFAAANGAFEGYAKPIFRNMKVLSLKMIPITRYNYSGKPLLVLLRAF